jgi:predicted HTH transcriptional regulator
VEAVAEAIVNAVAHRDYTSNASVQVIDRAGSAIRLRI